MTVRLVPLKCLQCGYALPAQPDEIAFACPQCGQVARVEGEGIVVQPTQWAAPRAGVTPASWLPFWVFSGPVQFTRREIQGWASSATSPDSLWLKVRRLWVPAFAISVEQAKQWGAALTRGQPEFQAGPAPAGAPLRGCVVTPDDARELAEFVVLSIEAERSDMLKDIAFTLPDTPPELWMLPTDGRQLVTG